MKKNEPPRPSGGLSEDFSLKFLCIRGNKSPAPQFYALKGGELNPIVIKAVSEN
jgi:hypothetical protein